MHSQSCPTVRTDTGRPFEPDTGLPQDLEGCQVIVSL